MRKASWLLSIPRYAPHPLYIHLALPGSVQSFLPGSQTPGEQGMPGRDLRSVERVVATFLTQTVRIGQSLFPDSVVATSVAGLNRQSGTKPTFPLSPCVYLRRGQVNVPRNPVYLVLQ